MDIGGLIPRKKRPRDFLGLFFNKFSAGKQGGSDNYCAAKCFLRLALALIFGTSRPSFEERAIITPGP